MHNHQASIHRSHLVLFALQFAATLCLTFGVLPETVAAQPGNRGVRIATPRRHSACGSMTRWRGSPTQRSIPIRRGSCVVAGCWRTKPGARRPLRRTRTSTPPPRTPLELRWMPRSRCFLPPAGVGSRSPICTACREGRPRGKRISRKAS